jgi:hypothetical protein
VFDRHRTEIAAGNFESESSFLGLSPKADRHVAAARGDIEHANGPMIAVRDTLSAQIANRGPEDASARAQPVDPGQGTQSAMVFAGIEIWLIHDFRLKPALRKTRLRHEMLANDKYIEWADI